MKKKALILWQGVCGGGGGLCSPRYPIPVPKSVTESPTTSLHGKCPQADFSYAHSLGYLLFKEVEGQPRGPPHDAVASACVFFLRGG